MTTRAILLRAADLIEERGWTRTWEKHGRICAVHAVDLALDGYIERRDDVLRPLARVVGIPNTHALGGPIGAWNDAQPSRVPVLRALREAAGE